MQLQVRQMKATPWETFGLDSLDNGLGLLRTVQIWTDAGLREQVLNLGFHPFSDGRRKGLFHIITNYPVIANDGEGWLGLELTAKGERVAGVPIRVRQDSERCHLSISDPDHLHEIVICFSTGLDLVANVGGSAGSSTSFPIPGDLNFVDLYKSVVTRLTTGKG